MNKNFVKYIVGVLGLNMMGSAFALENTKVLPKGVRSLDFKNVNTSVGQKTNEFGDFRPLADPLAKELTFKRIINGEKGINRLLLESFLEGKFREEDSVGVFSSDMRGNISVRAGIFSYGITDKLTLAIGVPFYQAKVNVRMGFQTSDNALKLINYLNDPANNQQAKAREVALKLTNSVGELNNKLITNGYSPLEDWERSGIGDVTLGAKYLFLDTERVKIANGNGITAPTGFPGDPNVLISVPFGSGTWALYEMLYIDEYITREFWLNQYVKYTYHAPAKKTLRLKTEDESIEVPEDRIRFKLGNRWETGVSTQYEPWFGLVFGTGLSLTGKAGDRYDTDNKAAQLALEKNTDDRSSYWETRVGYQSIPAFLRKEMPIPFIMTLEYKKHLRSSNTVVKDLLTFDFNVCF